MPKDFTGITVTKAELREGGYFHQAKLIVLRDLFLQKKSSSQIIEKEAPKKSVQGSALFDYKWSMLDCGKWNYVRKLFYLTCSYYFLVRI